MGWIATARHRAPITSPTCSSRTTRELCAPRSILLNAVRVDAEEKRDLSRVVRIEKDLDLILTIDVVAVCMRRAHNVAVYLTRTNPEVDRFRRVPHQYLGGLVGRATIDWLILRKAGEPSCSAPYRLVEVAVDTGDCIDSRDIDVRASGAPAVHEC